MQQELHRYACIPCRTRKIKCDNILTGCSNCVKTHIQCVYAARRSRKPQNSQRSIVRPLRPASAPPNHAEITEPSVLDLLKEADQDESQEPEPELPAEINGFTFRSVLNRKQVTKAGSLLQAYHPPHSLKKVLWDYYVRNFDPLVKILFKPAVESKATADVGGISQSTETLLFAIWFVTVNTMTPEECFKIHHNERKAILSQYRYALEKSLSQADWMNTEELEVLQAVLLFLVCSPGSNARGVWMLSGICVGIAVAMGLHRESTDSSLTWAQVETRRRVWWTLCLFDNRVSDECGLEVHVPSTMNTALPIHLNDEDLRHDATKEPEVRFEFTDMTLSLFKLEMAQTNLEIKMASYSKRPFCSAEVELLAHETVRRIETNYLSHLNSSNHIHRLCNLGARLIITKLWNLAYTEFPESHLQSRQSIKDKLITYNAEILDIAYQLPNENVKFGWFFRCKHVQLHALAFLLAELTKAPQGRPADRAWAVIDNIIYREDSSASSSLSAGGKHQVLWRKLLNRARSVRKQVFLQGSEYEGHPSVTPQNSFDDATLLLADHGMGGTYDIPLLDPFFGWTPDLNEEMNWF